MATRAATHPDRDIIRSIAKGLASDPDALSAKNRAGALIGGSALFMMRRYGPHQVAGVLYRLADKLAVLPDKKETRT